MLILPIPNFLLCLLIKPETGEEGEKKKLQPKCKIFVLMYENAKKKQRRQLFSVTFFKK